MKDNKKAPIKQWRDAVKKWKKHMNLNDWKIKIYYADLYEDSQEEMRELIAEAFDVYPEEKRATIRIDHNYYTVKGNGFGWNIDTVVIHELSHVRLTSSREMLPKKIIEHEGVQQFEENICDIIADLLYKAKGYKL